MTQPTLPWALIVVGNRSPDNQANRAAGVPALDPPSTVLSRALSLTSIAKTGCLIESEMQSQWNVVTQRLWPANVFALPPAQAVLDGVIGCLHTISLQEPEATVILVPYNHCAVEELTWRSSAAGALHLAANHRNTVYFLHDNPDNDPRVALKKPQICTSSVMISSVAALTDLCLGRRETTVVDLVVEKPTHDDLAADTDASAGRTAKLNLVHIRLVEEYSRLQRGEVWHRRPREIDTHA